jgi:hypothetical protein
MCLARSASERSSKLFTGAIMLLFFFLDQSRILFASAQKIIRSLLWLRWDIYQCYTPPQKKARGLSMSQYDIIKGLDVAYNDVSLCFFCSNQHHDLDGCRETAMASNKIHDEWCHEFSVDCPPLPQISPAQISQNRI